MTDPNTAAAALRGLITEMSPHLNAKQRNDLAAELTKGQQLTAADLDSMSPEQIVKAKANGQFDTLLNGGQA